jgi:hypothetical protein
MKEPGTLEEAFETVCKELAEKFITKHKDYGKDNILEIGELGIAFRESEKISRLKHLLKSEREPEYESLDENWIDVAVYAVIAVMFRRGWFQKLEPTNPTEEQFSASPEEQSERDLEE